MVNLEFLRSLGVKNTQILCAIYRLSKTDSGIQPLAKTQPYDKFARARLPCAHPISMHMKNTSHCSLEFFIGQTFDAIN